MNRLAKDIISSEVFLLLFLFSSGFVSFIYLFIGNIRAKEFYSLSEKKLTWESRVLRKKHLSREGEKSGCSRLGQQSYFDFNYTPEARLTSARGRGEKGRVKKKGGKRKRFCNGIKPRELILRFPTITVSSLFLGPISLSLSFLS